MRTRRKNRPVARKIGLRISPLEGSRGQVIGRLIVTLLQSSAERVECLIWQIRQIVDLPGVGTIQDEARQVTFALPRACGGDDVRGCPSRCLRECGIRARGRLGKKAGELRPLRGFPCNLAENWP